LLVRVPRVQPVGQMTRGYEEVKRSVCVDVIGFEAPEVVPELREKVVSALQLEQPLYVTAPYPTAGNGSLDTRLARSYGTP
jgi:hypothetical protein